MVEALGGVGSGGDSQTTILSDTLTMLPTAPATQATLASVLAKLISAPATEAKQDGAIAATNMVGTRAYGAAQRLHQLPQQH